VKLEEVLHENDEIAGSEKYKMAAHFRILLYEIQCSHILYYVIRGCQHDFENAGSCV
jgi:hypothetical protein